MFPDHWSFLLGEIALYSFIVLVLTGTFLALFFNPSTGQIVYHGAYAPLAGQQVSAAYSSTLALSFTVKGGLLMRQTHHWAALVFVAAITLHLLRIVFTGAFRKPRELNYLIGVTMLAVAILEGFCGYSLPDDLLSGIGLAIAWGVAMSIPFVGGPFATALWGGVFPGSTAFESRLYIVHVFVIPALLADADRRAPGDDHAPAPHPVPRARPPRGQRRRDARCGPATRCARSACSWLVAAVLVLMGGLIQINPIWLWGPYHTYIGTNGAQPDWYLGWLIGALRLMPNLEISIGGHTLVPNPFFGGVLFPGSSSRCSTRCRGSTAASSRATSARHHCSTARATTRAAPPSPPPCSRSFVVFAAGSADRLFVVFDYSYEGAIDFFRVAFFVVPVLVYVLTRRICVGARAQRAPSAARMERQRRQPQPRGRLRDSPRHSPTISRPREPGRSAEVARRSY